MRMEEKNLTGYASIDKPWLKWFSQEQLDFEFTPMSMFQMMKRHNEGHEQEIALSYFGNKISYKKLFDKIEDTARALLALGIKKGAIVMMSLPNIPEAAYVFYAVNRIGAILNTFDPRTSIDVIKQDILESNSKCLIIVDVIYPKIKDILKDTPITDTVLVSPYFSLPFVLRCAVNLKQKPVKYPSEITKWNDFLCKGKEFTETIPDIFEAGQLAVICHTGGSTGTPKGVMLSNESCNALIYQLLYTNYGFRRNRTFLNILPPFIALGLINATHLALCAGIQSILIPSFEPEDIPNLIMKHKPNIFMGGPIHFNMMLNDPKMQKEDLSYLELCCAGGDKMPRETQIKIQQFLENHHSNAKIWIGYGATETSAGTACMNNHCFKYESVGVPYLHNIFEVFDVDTGEKIKGYGNVGELRVSSPTLMLGYFGSKATETPSAIHTDDDGRCWYCTGDLGHIDEDGLIYIDGRIKRIITRRGFKIYPLYIEELILQHPAVKNCAVVGVPDEVELNIPVANIVLHEECKDKEQEVIEYINRTIKDQLPEYSLMAGYNFLEELPLTPIGKLDFKALEKLGIMSNADKRMQNRFTLS